MKIKVLFMFLLPALIYSQDNIIRDTSFTINSAYEKIKEEFPFAKPATVNKEITIKSNIIYYQEGKRNLHLDLFFPESLNKKMPCIIIIHGGGWRSGHKEMEWAIASNIASKNFVTATIEYRLSTEALYPAAVLDIKNAILWIKENSEKFNIDTNKIILMGQSAGGQLAALAGVTCGIKKFEPVSKKHSTKIMAIIDIDGVLDMTTPSESGKDTIPSKPSAAKMWLGFTYKEKPEIWKEASPLTYISKNTPPMLFINSSIPRFHAGRDEAIEILKQYNIYSEVHTLENTPHTFWLFNPWQEKVINIIVSFVNKISQEAK
ncbi:alpha/beta hydrolase [Rosettibacter firmus]|uniref:alpha/beta hydrolase n=1 Tax=Rosettibacter firmus TaxID=3111522 RepID=UPI00336BD25E